MSGQAATAQAQAPQQQANVPDAQGQQEETFESLIAGKYKQQYDSAVGAAVQKAVKQRLKGQGAMKAQIEAMAPVVDRLGVLYGIDTSDPRKIDYAALAQKFGADNRLYEAEAMERGGRGTQRVCFSRGNRRDAPPAAGVPASGAVQRHPVGI